MPNRGWSYARERAYQAQKGATPRSPSTGLGAQMGSAASMGELVTYAERNVSAPQSPRANPYNKSGPGSRAWEMGKKFGQRAALGRAYIGNRGLGLRGGHIAGLARSLARSPLRFGDTARTIQLLLSVLENVTSYDASVYTTDLNCGSAADFATGLSGFSNCNPGVVAKDTAGMSTGGSTVWTWRIVEDYINPDFWVADPVQRFTRSVFDIPAFPITVGPGLVPTPINAPADFATPLPTAGMPMAWAPDFSRPANEFSRRPGTETEQFYGPLPTTGGGGGSQPAPLPQPVPMPGTQVVAGPPASPPLGDGVLTPPRPPRKGTKEVKFGASKIMLRLLRLALAMTEALDDLDAIYTALPAHVRKGCKAAARQRHARNVARGEYWGTQSRGMMPHEKLQCLYNNLDALDMNHVMYNLVKTRIEDLFAGAQYGAIDKSLRSSRGMGGPTSTRQPGQAVSLDLPEFDDPFWDDVGDYIESKGRGK